MREWLKNARNSKGYTMAEMGGLLDISESYYSYIERGERQKRMDVTLAIKLAKVLGMTLAEVIEEENKILA